MTPEEATIIHLFLVLDPGSGETVHTCRHSTLKGAQQTVDLRLATTLRSSVASLRYLFSVDSGYFLSMINGRDRVRGK